MASPIVVGNNKTASLEKKKEKGGKSAKALGKRRKKGSMEDAHCPVIKKNYGQFMVIRVENQTTPTTKDNTKQHAKQKSCQLLSNVVLCCLKWCSAVLTSHCGLELELFQHIIAMN